MVCSRLAGLLQHVGHLVQDLGALFRRGMVPVGGVGMGQAQGLLHRLVIGQMYFADGVLAIGGAAHGAVFPRKGLTADDGCGDPGFTHSVFQTLIQFGQGLRVAEVDPAGIETLRRIDVARQGDTRMAFLLQYLSLMNGVGDDLFHRRVRVDDLIDKGGVGAVFQQPPHQVGQQFFVAAHRGIDAAVTGQLLLFDGHAVQAFAHAVQALEFVIPVAGHHHDAGQGMGIVGGELGIKGAAAIQNALGAGQVGGVGGALAAEHGVVGQALLLGALDLRVPVGAFDKTNGDAMSAAVTEFGEPVDDEDGTLLIGLQCQAETVPGRERLIQHDLFKNIQGQLEAIRLFRVHGQVDIGLLGRPGQLQQTRRQFLYHALALGVFIARMQGR